MSQNKNIVANNQNFIPSSEGSNSAENENIGNGTKAKNQSFIAKSENSRTAGNGFMNNGNASITAAEQGTRNKN